MLTKENIKDIYPLSPMQEGMYFHSIYDETSFFYFEQYSYQFCGSLDIKLVERSLVELFRRHDILRTVFIQKKGHRVLQVVLKERNIDFYYEDIRERKTREDYITSYKEQDKRNPFDLNKDILMRMAVMRSGDAEYEFIWSFHHILMDGWCIDILVSEFLEIYNSFIENRPYQLPPVKPYRIYIDWIEKKDKEESEKEWIRYLAGYETPIEIPGMKSAKIKKSGYKDEQVISALDPEITDNLKRLASIIQVSMNTIIQVVWGIILSRYNHSQDVVFGVVVSGRPGAIEGVESMVGLFINTIPVRIKYEDNTTITKLLQKVQKFALDMEPYHYHSLAVIQSLSNLKQNLVNHIIIFENFPTARERNDDTQLCEKNYEDVKPKLSKTDVFEQTNYDFNILISLTDRLCIKILYNGNKYEKESIERIVSHFSTVIDQIFDNRKQYVIGLTFLSEEEKKQLLLDFNDTRLDYPGDKMIHELFEQQVEKVPGAAAIVYKDEQLTYRALNNRSNHLAKVLLHEGITRDAVVGVIIERSMDMLVGILGILKSGGAYLPIDPEYPGERIDYMLKDSCTGLLITRKHLWQRNPGIRKLIDLEDVHLNIGDNIKPAKINPPANLSYVIYTSGSTGKPKGVMIKNKAVVNFINGIADVLDFGPGDNILSLTTLSFDIFGLETILPLTRGCKVLIGSKEEQVMPDAVALVILKEQVNIFQLTPSRLQMLFYCQEVVNSLSLLKYLLVGGEPFPLTLLERLKGVVRGKIYNLYGPTETTIWSTFKEVSAGKALNIGKPIANTRVYILSKNGLPQPILAIGELYIAGDGLAPGYLNDLELTVDKFTSSPFIDEEFIYKTGDLARWLPDGNIEFLGRTGHQVKIRGYRIELEEIEHQLQKHEKIKETIVLVSDKVQGDKYLCAYYVSDKEFEVSELREYLSNSLPEYMIPSFFIRIKSVHLTPNGKINREALPLPGITNEGFYTAPENEIEKKLVEIWSEILGIENDKISTDANFFELGGHSLKATQMIVAIHQELGLKISLEDVFKTPLIRSIAAIIIAADWVKNQEGVGNQEREEIVI